MPSRWCTSRVGLPSQSVAQTPGFWRSCSMWAASSARDTGAGGAERAPWKRTRALRHSRGTQRTGGLETAASAGRLGRLSSTAVEQALDLAQVELRGVFDPGLLHEAATILSGSNSFVSELAAISTISPENPAFLGLGEAAEDGQRACSKSSLGRDDVILHDDSANAVASAVALFARCRPAGSRVVVARAQMQYMTATKGAAQHPPQQSGPFHLISQVERDEVVGELKWSFKELAQSWYSKLLTMALVCSCITHRAVILLEFRRSAVRLLLHREAPAVLADAFELESYALVCGLKSNPEKGAISNAISRRVLWEYLVQVNALGDEALQEKARLELFGA
ncbi:hypothetical protein DFH11DRAFT_1794411 [Phellopilus nigrolimitatus]|nr:hypothetical protein DFH11DRAFT_1794411 [Phellopilus nigrolimitatus]